MAAASPFRCALTADRGGFVRRFIRCVGAAAVAAPGSAGAAEFGDAVVLGPGVNPKIAVGQAGEAVAVWQRPRRAPGVLVAAVRSWDGTWSAPRTIGTIGPADIARSTSMDVAVDGQGNAVVVWSQIRRVLPRRESVMTVRRTREGHWSAPRPLATFSSPSPDVDLGTAGRGLRPRVALDANGAGVAVWARLAGPEQPRVNPGDMRYVVDAAVMGADGRWSPPQTLGLTFSRPALDVTRAGDAAVLWTTLTVNEAGAHTSTELLAATRRVGGAWSPPELVVGDQAQPVDDYLSPPDNFTSVQGAIERDGGLTAIWKRGAGDNELQVASRAGAGPWSAPVTLDHRVDFSAPTLLGAANSGQVHAVWLGEPEQDSNDAVLRAATRDANGLWSAPTAAFGRSSTVWTYLAHTAMSASGRVLALVVREQTGNGPPPYPRSHVEAYVRTPDGVWSHRHVLRHPKPQPRSCASAFAALADDDRGAAIWTCDAGTGHPTKVISATMAPP